MSTRMKGQGGPVSNGPKDPVNDEEFDSWRNQPHQAFAQNYGTSVSASSMAADPYMSSYYGMSFPYQNLGLGDGAWSNGSEAMTFLGGYGGPSMSGDQHTHYMDSMSLGGGGGAPGGPFGGFSAQPSFNYFHGGDYSAWGSSNVGGRKPNSHAGHYDDYYRDMYSAGGGGGGQGGGGGGGGGGGLVSQEQLQGGSLERVGAPTTAAAVAMKPVEQSMQGLSIVDKMEPGGKMVDCGGKGPVDFGGGGQMDGGGGMMMMGGGGGSMNNCQAPKKMTWASIASQPAKPQPKMKPKSIPPAPMLPGKHNMDIGTWESKNGGMKQQQQQQQQQQGGMANASRSAAWSGGGGQPGTPRGNRGGGGNYGGSNGAPCHVVGPNGGGGGVPTSVVGYPHPVLDKLRQSNEYNPKEFDLIVKNARFFIIKSYSEDDIHRSIKYGIWCSTEHGNKRLDAAFRDQVENKGGVIYLLFSVNGSGHFCGVAQMTSPLDYGATSSVWAQDKWKGEFKVKWIYVKDVPNSQLRHIHLENNDNKPVTNSRDTQEVLLDKGRQVLKIIHAYRHMTSIFDDFIHYEKRQEEEDQRKHVVGVGHPQQGGNGGGANGSGGSGQPNERERGGGQIRADGKQQQQQQQ